MKKAVFLLVLLICYNYASTAYLGVAGIKPASAKEAMFNDHAVKMYASLNESSLGFNAFQLALKGYYALKAENKLSNPDVLTIIDYSKSANEKRFYLIDMVNGKLLLKSMVAHGRNTGVEYATSFSNKPNSYKSSLGFFVTGETYTGEHGLSLRLDGTEKVFNSNARMRAIVMHGADYVSKGFIDATGRLGRSLGCPALPSEHIGPVIEKIKNGSCIFAYYPDPSYLAKSKLANSPKYLEAYAKEIELVRSEEAICEVIE